MAIESALNRLRAISEGFPEWERPTFHPPASIEDVRELEQAIGAPLPTNIREFLLLCSAIVAMDIHNGYWIGGVRELARSVIRGDFPRTVEAVCGSMPVVPIATDGGGNASLASIEGNWIGRWDHETGKTVGVATSFVEFLNRVALDWEHSAAGTEGWRYMV
jgi:cell wall assembly regulator SMI1